MENAAKVKANFRKWIFYEEFDLRILFIYFL